METARCQPPNATLLQAFLPFLPHTSGCSFVASLLSRLYACCPLEPSCVVRKTHLSGNQLLRHLPSMCEALGQLTNRKCWPTLVILAVWGWRQVDQKFKVIISFAGSSRPARAALFETLFQKQTKKRESKERQDKHDPAIGCCDCGILLPWLMVMQISRLSHGSNAVLTSMQSGLFTEKMDVKCSCRGSSHSPIEKWQGNIQIK